MKKSKKPQSKQNQCRKQRNCRALARMFALCSIVALIFTLIAASQWEGNGAVSPDILERGYFAATNSFPRNTIVDITNLENGRKIRVVIVDGLDNPGLLVTLSKDAAETIGLPLKSLGRVRMEQPSEEEAYSEFIKGKGNPPETAVAQPAPAPSPAPDPDPVAQAPAGTLPSKQTALPPPEEEAPPPVAVTKPPVQPEDISTNYLPPVPKVELKNNTNPQPAWTESADQTGTRTPDITPISDSNKENIEITITEHPDVEPLASVETELPLPLPETTQSDLQLTNPDTPYDLALVPDNERPPEAPPPPELPPELVIAPLPLPDMLAIEETPLYIDESLIIESTALSQTPDPVPDTTAFIAPVVEPRPDSVPDTTAFIAPVAELRPNAVPDTTAFIAPVAELHPNAVSDTTAFIAPVPGLHPNTVSDTTASIMPVPETLYPDPNEFIAPLTETSYTSVPDPSAFIAPIAAVPPPVTDSASFITPVSAVPPRVSTPSTTTPANGPFSIPFVTRLEQGQYYVQLRAYNRKDQLEDAAATIGRAYPLTAQSVGTQDSPLFRLLVGPVNLGESGALLQRFKGIGYKDAFIRRGS